MPPMQIFEVVIFAALAAVVLYNLYSVLGRRIGRQPGETPAPVAVRAGAAGEAAALAAPEAEVELTGLAALKARDGAFEADAFLNGARVAYETIVRAFSAGDRATLKGLLSPHVMAGFEKAMAARDAEGRAESVEFVHPARADIEDTQIDGDVARIRVRFLAELTRKTKGSGGESSEDRRTAEAWTFERNLTSSDPNWILVRVDAAEA